jgi:hypothetical protein
LKRLVDYDPNSGITTYSDYDSTTDVLKVGYEYDDVSQILDSNKVLQNDEQYTKDGIKNDWWHYAHIPLSIVHKWLVEEGINAFSKDDARKVFQKLNSPEYRYLKTTTKTHMVKS